MKQLIQLAIVCAQSVTIFVYQIVTSHSLLDKRISGHISRMYRKCVKGYRCQLQSKIPQKAF
jgi:hypothetical protein